MSEPIPFPTTRYRCPHCPRTGASKARIRDHIGRCWTNPEVRGCKTCKHFEPTSEQCCGMPNVYECYTPWCSDVADRCHVGESLAGRPKCGTCKGNGQVYADGEFGGVSECPDCGGDGKEIKPGPIVGCHAWELAEGRDGRD